MARLLVDQLAKANTKQDFLQILQPQPRLSTAERLNQLYTLFLQRITEQAEGDAKLGKSVLRELLSAHQPMRAESLLDAVAEDAGWDKTNDQDRMEERINRCVRCCMNLVVRCKDNTIQFPHFTVESFLQAHGIPD
jgi:hypothetical protein